MIASMLDILIVGGTGATGEHLVRQLLNRGHRVRVIVRTPEKLPDSVRHHENITVVIGNALEMSDAELVQHVQGCDAIASCLGHTLSFGGILGPPWRLVTDSATRLCQAAQASEPAHPVRFVLMNSTGCRDHAAHERVSIWQRLVVQAIRMLIPPHADNEAAVAFFQNKIGQSNPNVQWVVVRPDSLINEDGVTPYHIQASPSRSAIFDPGKTSRINAAHFMTELMTDSDTWSQWVGQMPVIYNTETP